MKPKFYLLALISLLPATTGLAQEVTTGSFTGADPGEGLDLTTDAGSTFVYAVNVGGSTPIQVGDLTFTDDRDVPGFTWEAVNHIANWGDVNDFGPDEADSALADVMHSIRWTAVPGSVKITLEDVTPGAEHRLQLMFAEKCCQRGWDIMVNGELVADEFSARALTNDADLTMGAFFRYDFVPTEPTIEIDLNGENADFADRNPILSAVTLERIGSTDADPNLVSRTALDFGQVPSTPAVTQSFDLRNVGGTNTLEISEIRFVGPNADRFQVTEAAPIAPSGIGTVEVSFDAGGMTGFFQATMEIASNDPEELVRSVELSASVLNRNGPAGAFPFDDTDVEGRLTETSGNNRHGVFVPDVGAVTVNQEGLAGGTAARFGNGGYARVEGPLFEEALDSFALSLWMRPDGTPEALQTLLGKGDVEQPVFALLMFSDTLAWFSGGEAPEAASASVFQGGETYHVAAVYDNTLGARRLSLYVNGASVLELDDPIALADSLDFDVVMGAYNGVLPYNGVLDEVQIYDRAISAADVKFLNDNPGSSLGGDGAIDSDGDGLLDAREAELGTDPLSADTDGDGLEDGSEVNQYLTDPLNADSDGDGFDDGTELRKGSDPNQADSIPDRALVVGTFTGGDPDEGLDMEGSFLYAVNAFGPGGSRVGDALFTDDSVDGVTIEAANMIPNWHAPNYGESENDDGLETVLQSIRWDTAPVQIDLGGLTIGRRYVLQLLFAESCCVRGFDIVIEEELEADEFSPDAVHSRSTSMGVVATYTFTAADDTLNITLANEDANFPDTNPIINGFTLKEEGSEGDSDGDGLLDSWENGNFGDVFQTGTGDPDNDGLNNLGEFESNTSPNVADTDGDGLNDGAEVNDHGTDPLLSDTDTDGLGDITEVNGPTDPLNPDSDGDGQLDGPEIAFSGDPSNAAVQGNIAGTIGAFTGGDAGEGLDLEGDFVYAINMLGEGDLTVGEAMFTDDTVEGFSFDQPNEILDWHLPEYGDSPNDDALEIVMQSIRWNAGPVNMDLAGLTPGARYQLQMLFAENCCDRGWDIVVAGGKVFDDFNVQMNQGGIAEPSMGVVTTVIFFAPAESVSIRFLNEAPAFPDNNPILNGLTLEALSGDAPQPGGDRDGDGQSDEAEAIAGTDPDNAADYFRVSETTRLNDRVQIRWPAVDGKSYRVEYSVSLESDSWITIAEGLTGDGVYEDSDADRLGSEIGFYRIATDA